jgi:hypothetical protein
MLERNRFKENLMFKTTAAAIALATLALPTLTLVPAQAGVEYPWCVQYPDSTVGGTNCGFVTLAQCSAAASGIAGRCYENPAYPEVAKTKRQRAPRY